MPPREVHRKIIGLSVASSSWRAGISSEELILDGEYDISAILHFRLRRDSEPMFAHAVANGLLTSLFHLWSRRWRCITIPISWLSSYIWARDQDCSTNRSSISDSSKCSTHHRSVHEQRQCYEQAVSQRSSLVSMVALNLLTQSLSLFPPEGNRTL
jgi:hypothetical protein